MQVHACIATIPIPIRDVRRCIKRERTNTCVLGLVIFDGLSISNYTWHDGSGIAAACILGSTQKIKGKIMSIRGQIEIDRVTTDLSLTSSQNSLITDNEFISIAWARPNHLIYFFTVPKNRLEWYHSPHITAQNVESLLPVRYFPAATLTKSSPFFFSEPCKQSPKRYHLFLFFQLLAYF